MFDDFIVFQIDSGVVSSTSPLPTYFHRIATSAYQAVRLVGGVDVEQSKIVEMVTRCLRILEQRGWDRPAERQRVDKISSLTAYARDAEEVAFLIDAIHRPDCYDRTWEGTLHGIDEIQPSQMLAAYCLMKTDLSAAAYLTGETDIAMQMLAEACVVTAAYGFSWGFTDRTEMAQSDGAMASWRRWEPLKEVEGRAIELYQKGQWKSMRQCAIKIQKEIHELAASKNIKLSNENAERTIYEWIRAAKKRAG